MQHAELEVRLWGILGGERLPLETTRTNGEVIIPVGAKIGRRHVKAMAKAGLDIDLPTSPLRLTLFSFLNEHYKHDRPENIMWHARRMALTCQKNERGVVELSRESICQAFPVGDEEASYAAALKALRKELPEWNPTFTGKTDDVLWLEAMRRTNGTTSITSHQTTSLHD